MNGTSRGWRGAARVYVSYVALLAFMWGLYLVAPGFHASWFQNEDSVPEWITFFAFFGGGVLALRCLAFRTRMKTWEKLYIAGLAAFLFLCAGEEISWGQRIIGFQIPELLEKENEQREFNLHNLSLHRLRPVMIFGAAILMFGIVLPVVLYKWNRHPGGPARRYVAPPWMVPCFLFSDILKPVVRPFRPWIAENLGSDVSGMVWHETKEHAEMFWALSLFLALWSIRAAWKQHASGGAPP